MQRSACGRWSGRWSAWQAARVELNQDVEPKQREADDLAGDVGARMVKRTAKQSVGPRARVGRRSCSVDLVPVPTLGCRCYRVAGCRVQRVRPAGAATPPLVFRAPDTRRVDVLAGKLDFAKITDWADPEIPPPPAPSWPSWPS